ncbi:hypothetical protein [Chryseobacterium sp. c4a]|uniref:hypothetical protein n=1 Tax=Chryseobacterium sp. c4a TaxID=1573582 RepID=UPI00135C3DA0|nr:hypothetical protein [Chryseobacterium sp. c4a]
MEVQNSLKNNTPEMLAYIYFMAPHSYSEEYIQSIKEELENRNYNFGNFNEYSYIQYFIKDLYPGWEKEGKRMFAELSSNGWTYLQPIQYKYSWGVFTMKGFRAGGNEKLCTIIDKYLDIYESTCSQCGSRKRVESSLQEPFCKKCKVKKLKNKRIRNINQLGFTYYDKKIHRISWSEIKQVYFEINDSYSYHIELKRLTKEEEQEKEFDNLDYIFFSDGSLNFFKLLTKIPRILLSDGQYNEINTVCNHFEKCIVCHRKSVFNNQCIICRNRISSIESPTPRNLERFNSKAGILKYEQKLFKQTLEYWAEERYRYETESFFKSK